MANSSNNRGNQTKYELELSPDEGVETIGDLFNPGHPDSGAEPRSDLVDIDAGQDISQPAKVTLGNYLGAASKGRVGVSRPNTFQLPAGSNSATAGFDSNSSGRLPPGATRSAIESDGATEGTFLDLARDYDPNARSFESTKDSTYSRSGNNPFLDSDISIKDYSDPDARARGQSGNSILLNIKPRGAGSSAQPGNPEVGPLPEDTPLVQQKISEVLKNNRFNPLERTFVQNHTIQGTGTTLQRKLGVYEKDNGKVIRQDLLEKVGLKLMVRATGHGVSGLDLIDGSESLQYLNNTAPLLPSAPQLTGLPLIDVINLRAGNVAVAETGLGVGVTPESARAEYVNEIYIEGADRTQSDSRGVFTGKSYGVLNSHIEPFGGPLPIGTFTTTLAGISAIVGASSLVALLPSLLGSPGVNQVNRESLQTVDPSTLVMGQRATIGTDSQGRTTVSNSGQFTKFITDLLGIPRTDHNWGNCLLVGVASFFGLGFKPSPTGGFQMDTSNLGENIFYLATAPGYYAVIIRNAIRDTEQIVRGIEEFTNAASDGNVISSISGIFKIIESITTSALYRFMMSMTALGNQVLNQFRTSFENNEIPNALHSRRVDQPPASNVEVMGSRQRSALAWRHTGTPSKYFLPSSFDNLRDPAKPNSSAFARVSGGDLGKLKSRSGGSGVGFTSNRLGPAVVAEMENQLESEYVPFYFHDLRTNEIISFHAFLSNISDGFTASYSSTSGYGRADDVMVYNNTKRSLSFDFMLVATSEEDHSAMYWNVNKLVSMLYPQYSKGRVMQNGEFKFIQPFSQIPTASPMIRVRIGDIIKGNYSKFGLARLFGYGSSDFRVTNSTEEVSQRQGLRTPASLDDPSNWQVGDEVTFGGNGRGLRWYNANGDPMPASIMREAIASRSGEGLSQGNIQSAEEDLLIVSSVLDIEAVSSYDSSREPIGKITALTDQRSLQEREDGSVSSKWAIIRVDPADNPNFGLLSFIPAEWRYHKIALYRQSADGGIVNPAPSDRIKISSRFRNVVATRIGQAAQEFEQSEEGNASRREAEIRFFSGDNNPIVRSFETTAGKGLAGFITDLKLDYGDATWEIKEGSKAPHWIKIAVSFAPISDIPTGLDSDGMMRSVVYNVGNLSKIVGSDTREE